MTWKIKINYFKNVLCLVKTLAFIAKLLKNYLTYEIWLKLT
jgi:hypothetical protein